MDRSSLGCACLLLARWPSPTRSDGTHSQDLSSTTRQWAASSSGSSRKMNSLLHARPNLARGASSFRPEGATSWYYVEMKTDSPGTPGILPKPARSSSQEE